MYASSSGFRIYGPSFLGMDSYIGEIHWLIWALTKNTILRRYLPLHLFAYKFYLGQVLCYSNPSPNTCVLVVYGREGF